MNHIALLMLFSGFIVFLVTLVRILRLRQEYLKQLSSAAELEASEEEGMLRQAESEYQVQMLREQARKRQAPSQLAPESYGHLHGPDSDA